MLEHIQIVKGSQSWGAIAMIGRRQVASRARMEKDGTVDYTLTYAVPEPGEHEEAPIEENIEESDNDSDSHSDGNPWALDNESDAEYDPYLKWTVGQRVHLLNDKAAQGIIEKNVTPDDEDADLTFRIRFDNGTMQDCQVAQIGRVRESDEKQLPESQSSQGSAAASSDQAPAGSQAEPFQLVGRWGRSRR